MAKKNKILDSLTLITEQNRKFSITLGRECFVYDQEGNKLGEFTIRPRLRIGWFEFGPHKCKVTEEESASDYAESFDSIISHFVKEKKLYIDSSKKLITFKLPKT